MFYKILITLFLVNSLFSKNITFENFENISNSNLNEKFICTSLWEIEDENNNKFISMIKNTTNSFNLCYKKNLKIKDGKISVIFRANDGDIDQGGGLVYRVQDKNNYYVARYNPLEDNFRFYKVINSNRVELNSVNVSLENEYNTMTIVFKDNTYEAYLNNKLLLSGKDNSIKTKGSIGIWTKADAQTSFDDLKVEIN